MTAQQSTYPPQAPHPFHENRRSAARPLRGKEWRGVYKEARGAGISLFLRRLRPPRHLRTCSGYDEIMQSVTLGFPPSRERQGWPAPNSKPPCQRGFRIGVAQWTPACAGVSDWSERGASPSPLMKLFRVHFFIAAPGDGLLVLAEAQQPRRRAEDAHFGVVLEFFLARRRRVRPRA